MAIIPAITTGMIDFIISSGRMTAIAAIPVPDFAVPYAAPSAVHTQTTHVLIHYMKEIKRNSTIHNGLSSYWVFMSFDIQ